MNRNQTYIVGCGDIGRRVASLLLDADKSVEAWVRSEKSFETCRHMGLKTSRVDLDRPFTLNDICNRNDFLYTVPPPASGKYDTRLQAFLNTLDAGLVRRFVLLSTTGVYGNCAGAWVDESTPINPKADRALRRADAEARLREWALIRKVDYLILRVPGIYAADRLPLKRLQMGTPLVARNEAPWTNRIHADDLAAACFAALNSPVSSDIINVSDDAPGTMTEYFFAVADFAGLPRPAEISLQEARQSLSAGMLSYLAESRRINNTKMKSLLNVRLRYPSLKEGLAEPKQNN